MRWKHLRGAVADVLGARYSEAALAGMLKMERGQQRDVSSRLGFHLVDLQGVANLKELCKMCKTSKAQ